jgi:hypothetical protein
MVWLIGYLAVASMYFLSWLFAPADDKKPLSEWRPELPNKDWPYSFSAFVWPLPLLTLFSREDSLWPLFVWPFVLIWRGLRAMLRLPVRTWRRVWRLLKPKSKRTVADLKYFKNRQIGKIIVQLEAKIQRLASTIGELESWQRKLEELKAKILLDDRIDNDSITRIIEAVKGKLAEFVEQRATLRDTIKKLTEAQKTLDIRLEMHEMYRQIKPLLGILNSETELANDPSANIAAAQEVIKGVTAMLDESELTALSKLGIDPRDIARGQLGRNGVEDAPESSEEIIARAKKLLA